MREFWTWSAVAALVVGVIAWGAMFWAMIFHRKRAGDSDVPPRQTQYNLPIEIIFTVVPTIIVAVLFAFTVQVQNDVQGAGRGPGPEGGRHRVPVELAVHLPGHHHPDGGPGHHDRHARHDPAAGAADEPESIQFTQRSNDVIHSFWVPDFLFKRDVFPMPEKNDQD